MRLVCPNCDAQYEVDAGVIPDNGRDVQCSNCGNGWFQLPPEVEAEIAAEEALYEPPPAKPITRPATREATLPRRSVDESVMNILREEAARETSARVIEGSGLETQTEMGLQNVPSPLPSDTSIASAAAQRVSRLRGQPMEDLSAPVAEYEQSKSHLKSELLPEIDEINSSLRASSERRSTEPDMVDPGLVDMDEEKVRPSGFRSGFALILVLAAVLVAIYIMADTLSEQIPSMAAALKSYSAMVDQLRIYVDVLLQKAVGFLNGLIGRQA
jgi:predicted Zn finger-like uncharacterized protein